MLNETGTLLLGKNYMEVVAERPGYAKACPTKLSYHHPILGKVLVNVLEARYKHGREITYYNTLGEIIRLPDSYFKTELTARRLAPFKWHEYRLEGADQPWFEDILAKWDALQGQKPDLRAGTSSIKIWVTDYPVVDGNRANFWASATLTSKELPWYNPEYPAASNAIDWGTKNKIIATKIDDGQEVDLCVRFAPEAETYQGHPQAEHGDYFGKRRRVASAARPLKNLTQVI